MAESVAIYAVTKQQLGHVFGVHARTIGKWLGSGAPPKVNEGYDLRDWIAWWSVRQFGDATGSSDDLLTQAKVKYETARAEREAIRAKQDAGLVIDVVEAEKQRLAIVKWVVGVMDRAGSELASRLAGKKASQVKRIVGDYFDRVRREAADV